ncbi:hypothetical protein QTO30_04150 [Yoonia sp. GPGPB17]|uniref:hypothetical protein n=1 Tax=Yoonia sp. GPGPB17 TaxID=3026147 RepID=UPI0030BEB987
MIIVGNQRGNGLKLAAHLMNDRDNDHVELHDLRGFTADNLHGAFQEADAILKGTKCQQFLFSLSINPPETEKVSIHQFETAIERAERTLGLQDQARAIVFHEAWAVSDTKEAFGHALEEKGYVLARGDPKRKRCA